MEAFLPKGFRSGPGFGSSGLHREFYTIGSTWRIAVIYRSPDMSYRAYPGQVLIGGPVITCLDSDTQDTYKDPHGSFLMQRFENERNR